MPSDEDENIIENEVILNDKKRKNIEEMRKEQLDNIVNTFKENNVYVTPSVVAYQKYLLVLKELNKEANSEYFEKFVEHLVEKTGVRDTAKSLSEIDIAMGQSHLKEIRLLAPSVVKAVENNIQDNFDAWSSFKSAGFDLAGKEGSVPIGFAEDVQVMMAYDHEFPDPNRPSIVDRLKDNKEKLIKVFSSPKGKFASSSVCFAVACAAGSATFPIAGLLYTSKLMSNPIVQELANSMHEKVSNKLVQLGFKKENVEERKEFLGDKMKRLMGNKFVKVASLGLAASTFGFGVYSLMDATGFGLSDAKELLVNAVDKTSELANMASTGLLDAVPNMDILDKIIDNDYVLDKIASIDSAEISAYEHYGFDGQGNFGVLSDADIEINAGEEPLDMNIYPEVDDVPLKDVSEVVGYADSLGSVPHELLADAGRFDLINDIPLEDVSEVVGYADSLGSVPHELLADAGRFDLIDTVPLEKVADIADHVDASSFSMELPVDGVDSVEMSDADISDNGVNTKAFDIDLPIEPESIEYTIEKGDNLWTLGTEHYESLTGEKPTPQQLVSLINELGLDDPNSIQPGDVVRFPTELDEIKQVVSITDAEGSWLGEGQAAYDAAHPDALSSGITESLKSGIAFNTGLQDLGFDFDVLDGSTYDKVQLESALASNIFNGEFPQCIDKSKLLDVVIQNNHDMVSAGSGFIQSGQAHIPEIDLQALNPQMAGNTLIYANDMTSLKAEIINAAYPGGVPELLNEESFIRRVLDINPNLSNSILEKANYVEIIIPEIDFKSEIEYQLNQGLQVTDASTYSSAVSSSEISSTGNVDKFKDRMMDRGFTL